MTFIHNQRLDEELDLNLTKQVMGDIRENVDTKYQDLEKLLSSNLGDKLKEVCDIQCKPSIPKPHNARTSSSQPPRGPSAVAKRQQ